MARYDIVYHASGEVTAEPHFCRELGCFGTDPNHGFTLAEAQEEIANHYQMIADSWRDGTHHTYIRLKEM